MGINWSPSICVFQIVQTNEKSKTLHSCSHKNDFNYDNCVYSVHGEMMKEQLNCTFGFLFGKNNSNETTTNEEIQGCNLNDVNGKDAFQDIVYGKKVFYISFDVKR